MIDFYEENLAHLTFTGGSYYCGTLMCVTIALSIAKRDNKTIFLHAKDRQYPQDKISEVCKKFDVFSIGKLDRDTFSKVYAEITRNNYNPKKFIRQYENACNNLGIREKDRIMTSEFEDYLIKKALRHSKSN